MRKHLVIRKEFEALFAKDKQNAPIRFVPENMFPPERKDTVAYYENEDRALELEKRAKDAAAPEPPAKKA